MFRVIGQWKSLACGAVIVLGAAAAMAGPVAAAASSDGGIEACAVKSGAKAGALRILTGSKKCKSSERSLTLAVVGDGAPTPTAGPAGPVGPKGDPGASGSPDTPAQELSKLQTVDGAGSGLDADLFDGLPITAFARHSTTGTGVVGLPSFGPHQCADYPLIAGGVQAGDFVVEQPVGQAWPAGLVGQVMQVSANTIEYRWCNVTDDPSPADLSIPTAWIGIN